MTRTLMVLLAAGAGSTLAGPGLATASAEFTAYEFPNEPFEFPGSSGANGQIVAGAEGDLWFTGVNGPPKSFGGGVGRFAPPSSWEDAASQEPSLNTLSFAVFGENHGITVDREGNAWFTVGGGVGRVKPGVTTAEDFFLPADPAGKGEYSSAVGGITVGPEGDLWFPEETGATAKIGRINPKNTGEFTEFPLPPGNELNDAILGAPIDNIAVGPEGNLWFTERDYFAGGHAIGVINTRGEFLHHFEVGPSPEAIVAGADGNMWFTRYGGTTVGRITPAGAVTEFPLPVPGVSDGSAMVQAPDGNVWFTIDGGGGGVGCVTPTGQVGLHFAPAPIAGQGTPWGLALRQDGSLWYTLLGTGGASDKLVRYAPLACEAKASVAEEEAAAKKHQEEEAAAVAKRHEEEETARKRNAAEQAALAGSLKIAKIKVRPGGLLVTIKMSRAGVVMITGPGLKKSVKTLRVGTHQISVVFTKAGRAGRVHHRKIKLVVTLNSAGRTASFSKVIKL